MILKKALTLSIVIPVYNEEHHILHCLLAIQRQTVLPYEVILVDNNCTDATIDIATKFSFVKIIKEPKQGRGWARTTGFGAARGDIIGRIDADSRMAPNWVEVVIDNFTNDQSVQGITGIGSTSLLPRLGKVFGTFWSRAYYWIVHGRFRTITMWGANMALRRSAWEAVGSDVCNDDAQVHEDQDISLCMAAKGLKIVQNNRMLIRTKGQSYHYLPKLYAYWRLRERTYALHEGKGTFISPKLHRIPLIKVLPGMIAAGILSVPFVILSIALLPLDKVMLALGRQKSWLD